MFALLLYVKSTLVFLEPKKTVPVHLVFSHQNSKESSLIGYIYCL